MLVNIWKILFDFYWQQSILYEFSKLERNAIFPSISIFFRAIYLHYSTLPNSEPTIQI